MRRMSFSATVPQMRAGTKTVTRRHPDTWAKLKPGDHLLAVEKAMGLKAGERQVAIGVIEIVDVRVEPLRLIAEPGEAQAEGFATCAEFWRAWMRLHGGTPEGAASVRRIEFRHLNDGTDR